MAEEVEKFIEVRIGTDGEEFSGIVIIVRDDTARLEELRETVLTLLDRISANGENRRKC